MPVDDQAPSGARDPNGSFEHNVRILSGDMLNGKLIAAARALLGWSQIELAERAGVRRQTLAEFEGDVRRPQARVREAVVSVLQREGIRFVSVEGALGPLLEFEPKS